MTFLVILWSLSLLVIVVLGFFGLRATGLRGVFVSAQQPRSLQDFFISEALHSWGRVGGLLLHLRPHMLRAAAATLAAISRQVDRGQVYVMRKIFGRLELERGPAPSFYLKSIAETTKTGTRDETLAGM